MGLKNWVKKHFYIFKVSNRFNAVAHCQLHLQYLATIAQKKFVPIKNIVVSYYKDYVFPKKHPVYHGASPVALVNLAKKKGCRLVGANDLGLNFIFVKNGLAIEALPEVSTESVLTHFSLQKCYQRYDEVKGLKFIAG